MKSDYVSLNITLRNNDLNTIKMLFKSTATSTCQTFRKNYLYFTVEFCRKDVIELLLVRNVQVNIN